MMLTLVDNYGDYTQIRKCDVLKTYIFKNGETAKKMNKYTMEYEEKPLFNMKIVILDLGSNNRTTIELNDRFFDEVQSIMKSLEE